MTDGTDGTGRADALERAMGTLEQLSPQPTDGT